MKVLLVHNFYGSGTPSGENQVFELEKAMLQARGHDVAEFTRHSNEIRVKGMLGTLQGALATPWNPFMVPAIRRVVASFRPDVVHVHNTFPLISPAIFHAIGNLAACVLTLHNYRLLCPSAILMRGKKICTECLDLHSVRPALRYGCYRGSRLATVPLAFSITLHRMFKTWWRHVDAFIALSEFQSRLMINAGLPTKLMHVKANFYPGYPVPIPWPQRKEYVVFVGRLTPEKGVKTLIYTWLNWGEAAPELRIVGDGDLRDELERLARSTPASPIRFLGYLSSSDAQEQIAYARLLVLPSECFEGFPMVLREAFAFGTPVAVTNIGPLPTIVNENVNGVIFEPGDSESLLKAVRTAWYNHDLLESLSRGARRSFEKNYTEEANYETLMKIYEQAIIVNKLKSNKRLHF